MTQIDAHSRGRRAGSRRRQALAAGFWTLTLGSIGVVYGDIGTSPLYALREAVVAAVGADGAPTREAVLGVLSLILWALIIIVTLKYVLILLRADNKGEGGTLALMALAQRAHRQEHAAPLVLLGIISAALFYGDAMITPALSVLSAVEGLKIATPAFDPYVVPLTVVILVALFAVQSRGTARVAAFFGPITLVWFIAIAIAGVWHVAADPSVLAAINPVYGVRFLASHGMIGLVTLGAVFLAVTGAEALYADLGHFGRKPIQIAWLAVVLPSLALNYLGQGALVLANPKAIENPFFLLYPDWALLPMVVLATAATVIASQAVITGAYSLTQQAIQLGLLPRLEIRHTSETQVGQIYMPRVNALLLVGVLLLVVLFRSSSALASAYGIAVTGTMVVTALMAFVVICQGLALAALGGGRADRAVPADRSDVPRRQPAQGVRGRLDAARARRRGDGGDVHVAARQPLLFEKTRKTEVPLDPLVATLEKKPPQRVPGTAVFLTSDPTCAPTALMHSLKHYKVLHEKNVILTIEIRAGAARRSGRARADRADRRRPSRGCGCASASWKRRTCRRRWPSRASSAGSSTSCRRRSSCRAARCKPAAHSGMPRWQDRLFIALARSANDATDYFQIPTDRVVEVGTQVTI